MDECDMDECVIEEGNMIKENRIKELIKPYKVNGHHSNGQHVCFLKCAKHFFFELKCRISNRSPNIQKKIANDYQTH